MSRQTILITGATSGIGRHAALWLARRGHHIIASGRRQGALDSLVQEAGDLALHAVRLDVTDAASIAAAVAAVDQLTDGRGVDTLINNAGYGQGGAVLDVGIDAIRAQYETNVFGLVEVTRAFAAAMMRRGRGRIINISSIGGRMTFPLLGVYNSTKYAVESLSDAMRAELAPLGIRVILVEPGTIRSNFGSTVATGLQDAHSGPWGDIQARTDELLASFERFAPDPTPISKVLTRAVEASWPRVRYVAPWHDAILLRLATWLPSWVVDAVLGRLMGLHLVRRPSTLLTAVA